MAGRLIVATIGQLDADPSTWWYRIGGIDVADFMKSTGDLDSEAAARAIVEGAWRTWLEFAGLV